jgi:hypothetical protein
MVKEVHGVAGTRKRVGKTRTAAISVSATIEQETMKQEHRLSGPTGVWR